MTGQTFRIHLLLWLVLWISCLATVLPAMGQDEARADAGVDVFKVLVYSRTGGFRHGSIPVGIEAVRSLGEANNFSVEATEDPARFNDDDLASFDAVVFMNTTGDILDDDQQAAFERFIQGGGGYVGVHAAADTEYDWPWYGGLVGAYFKTHPRIQQATVLVADRQHIATLHLPARWVRTDEWYVYKENPRGKVHVLATLDETTYEGGGMDFDHPTAWCHAFDGGRAFYTGGGHTDASYADPAFRQHLLGGILWAAGLDDSAAAATIWDNYDKVVLDDDVSDPMELAVAPDGRVIFVERGGAIKVYRPDLGKSVIAGFINVFSEIEDGLLGVALDPDFKDNGWLYIMYSPVGDVPVQHVSRLRMLGDEIVKGSEVVILEIPTDREECCHSGGSLTFGPDGSLFISTGDNTNPFASDGYAPIDGRADRKQWDARRSSANTEDLRGKVLRIVPMPDGSYGIPDGNLFPRDGSAGRPEIYVMGCRNPFRISVDQQTGWLYWGDVGPDATNPREGRGPAGHDEYNRAKGPGNFGWPLFVGDNKPYTAYDFEAEASGEPFDPAFPINESPHNTGARILPDAKPAWIYYPYADTDVFPQLGSGGRCAMAGPVYHASPDSSKFALPAYFDKTLFIYEWTRNWIKEVRLDEAGEILAINDFMPDTPFIRPMDLELGPDGRLYVIEWGSAFGGGNDDAQLSVIEFYPQGPPPPIARSAATPAAGAVPLTVQFSSEGSRLRGSDEPPTFAWDFDGDGETDSAEPNPTHTFTEPGDYFVRLIVTDPNAPANQGETVVVGDAGDVGDVGDAGTAVGVAIAAGNVAPSIGFNWPPDGGFAGPGDVVEFGVYVFDAEDGSISPDAVSIATALKHKSHTHPLAALTGTTGTVTITADLPSDKASDIAAKERASLATVLTATYTDRGAPFVGPLTSSASVTIRPRRLQAQFVTTNHGTIMEAVSDPLGGAMSVAYIDDGDYVSYAPVNFYGITNLAFRVASATAGGSIELRLDGSEGDLLAVVDVEGTGGWQSWTDVTIPIQDPGGSHALFLVFRSSDGGDNGALFNINWIDFMGKGVAAK
jgi:cytochrome c